MFHTLEVTQAVAQGLILDTTQMCSDTCSQTVVHIVLTTETESLLFHIEGSGTLDDILSVGDIAYHTLLLQNTERTHPGLDAILLQFLLDDWVIGPVDKGIVLGLVLQDTHLGISIRLHAVSIAVQMVGGDVEQDGNVGSESVHIVELETAELYDVVIKVLALGYLECQAAAYISCQAHIIACLLEYVIDKAGGGGLAVGTCHTNHPGMGITSGKLYLADDGNTCLTNLLHHGSIFRNTRTLDHLGGIEYLLLGVVAFLPLYSILSQNLLIVRLYLSEVTHEDIIPLDLGQCGSTNATLGSTQNYYSTHIVSLLSVKLDFYLIFSVTMVNAAVMMVTIQKRMVILDSSQQPLGHLNRIWKSAGNCPGLILKAS